MRLEPAQTGPELGRLLPAQLIAREAPFVDLREMKRHTSGCRRQVSEMNTPWVFGMVEVLAEHVLQHARARSTRVLGLGDLGSTAGGRRAESGCAHHPSTASASARASCPASSTIRTSTGCWRISWLRPQPRRATDEVVLVEMSSAFFFE